MPRRTEIAICLLLASLFAASCGGRSTPVRDSDLDGDDGGGDADVDGDGDGDGDADSDADSDSDQDEYWAWTRVEAEIPRVLRTGMYSDGVKIWAVADDDVVLCNHDVEEEQGGIGRYDGVSFTVETEAIHCDALWATQEGVLVAFGEDAGAGGPAIVRRDGTTWAPEEVDGVDGCAFEAFYATTDGITMVSATCGDERRPFTRVGTSWAVSARWVPQTDSMTRLDGAFSVDAAWVPTLETVFFGQGVAVGDGLVATGYGDGYPEDVAFWAGFAASTGIVALGLRQLRTLTGDSWTEGPTCPDVLPHDLSPCWTVGASLPEGGAIVGGGAGTGDSGDDDWRLDWWDGATLHRTLAPCGQTPPHCGIDDLSLTEDRAWVAARGDGWSGLMWAPLPE